MVLPNHMSRGEDMDLFAILAESFNGNNSSTVKVAESVLHRLNVLLVGQVLPHCRLTMFFVSVDFNFEKRVC